MNIQEQFQLALMNYQTGNLSQSQHNCREILKEQPNNHDILNLLGVIFYDLGDFDSAIIYLNKAIEFNQNNVYAYFNLGNAYRKKGVIDEAIVLYQKAIRLNPNLADFYNNLGIVLQEKGQVDDALMNFKKAVELDPGLSDAYYNLGCAFQDKKQSGEAITCYKKALQLNPDLFDAYYNLGIIFQDKKQFDEAVVNYKKALEINPALADVHNNLGNIFHEKGDLEEAITHYQKVLQIVPDFADAYINLGIVLREKGTLDQAIEYFQKAIHIDPNCAAAFHNLGVAFRDKGKFDEALMNYQKALQINPNQEKTYYSLGILLLENYNADDALFAFKHALEINPNYFKARWVYCMAQIPIVYRDQLHIQDSRKRYFEELIKLRDSISLTNAEDIKAAADAIGSIQPFYLAYQGLNDTELQGIYGNLVCRIMALRYPHFTSSPMMPPCSTGIPLRIGMVSGHFYHHSVWKLFKGWVENLDRQRFTLYGYYTGKKKDKQTEIARQCFNHFVEDIYSFDKLCQIIRNDNLHVLIYPEIGMNHMSVRLASLRLAPIQCASWGHPDTSGLPTIDYFFSSDLMEPPDANDHYTENLIRLPNLSISYTPLEVPPFAMTRDIYGLRKESILYLCCQSLFKYLPQYDEIYPRIAHQVGNCQFLFIRHMSKAVTKQFRLRLEKAFNRFGMNSDDYIVFLPRLNIGQFFALNRLSDIYLDSIGWSGGNTTLEAINCNLPVVTFPGIIMRGRHSTAILTMMEVTETIASSLDQYIALAARLGKDAEWRRQISEKIAENKHRIYRDRTCITALEEFLEKVVREVKS